MQELNNTPMQENQEEESFNIYEIIFKYLVYWPWFVASVIACLVVAFNSMPCGGIPIHEIPDSGV